MGSPCFSSTLALRCSAVSSHEQTLILIPTALELAFATAVVFADPRNNRKIFLLFIAQGWSLFALTLVDMLSRILPAVRDNLEAFRAVDRVIGALSFLPLAFQLFFIYFLIRIDIADVLPQRFQRGQFLLLLFIILILGINEAASFAGISYRYLDNQGSRVVGIGFNTLSQSSLGTSEGLWTFFTRLALALYAFCELVAFFLSFIRVVRALLHQPDIEGKRTNEAPFINGAGWFAAGFMLGTTETVLGFAPGTFEFVLARRIIRLVSRVCLLIGLFRGFNIHLSFREIQDEMKESKRKKPHYILRSQALNISNPRLSTFMRVSPRTAGFPVFYEGSMGVTHTKGPRVTVLFNQDSAPSLHMRFSDLGVPAPAAIADSIHVESPMPSTATTHRYAPSNMPPTPERAITFARIKNPFARMAYHTREMSTTSRRSEPSSVLWSKFPGMPGSAATVSEMSLVYRGDSPAQSTTALSRNDTKASKSSSRINSIKRKPAPSTDSGHHFQDSGTFGQPISDTESVTTNSHYPSSRGHGEGTRRLAEVAEVSPNLSRDSWDVERGTDSPTVAALKSMPPSHLRTLGTGPERRTPSPTEMRKPVGSVHLQSLIIPERSLVLPEATQSASTDRSQSPIFSVY